MIHIELIDSMLNLNLYDLFKLFDDTRKGKLIGKIR